MISHAFVLNVSVLGLFMWKNKLINLEYVFNITGWYTL